MKPAARGRAAPGAQEWQRRPTCRTHRDIRRARLGRGGGRTRRGLRPYRLSASPRSAWQRRGPRPLRGRFASPDQSRRRWPQGPQAGGPRSSPGPAPPRRPRGAEGVGRPRVVAHAGLLRDPATRKVSRRRLHGPPVRGLARTLSRGTTRRRRCTPVRRCACDPVAVGIGRANRAGMFIPASAPGQVARSSSLAAAMSTSATMSAMMRRYSSSSSWPSPGTGSACRWTSGRSASGRTATQASPR